MIKIHSPNFKDAFRLGPKREKGQVRFQDIFHYEHDLFSPLFFLLVLLVLFFLLGVKYHSFRLAGLSTVFVVGVIYLRVRHGTRAITVKRFHSPAGREKETLTITYQIANNGLFSQGNIFISDFFEGTGENKEILLYVGDMAPLTFLEKKVTCPLDGGMGDKHFGSLKILLTDPLGFFPFVVENNTPDVIQIYPGAGQVPEFQQRGDEDSIHVGTYNIHRRGDSTDFKGTRKYQSGDPLKMINWKLSQKIRKIIVNEFEDHTNASVSLFLNILKNSHMDQGTRSTWDYCKELALSIAVRENQEGNYLQVFSDGATIPSGVGQDHIRFIELSLMKWNLVEGDKSSSTSASASASASTLLLQKYWTFLPRGSTVFFITPLSADPSFRGNLEFLSQLSAYPYQINVLIVDGFKDNLSHLKGESFLHLLAEQKEATDLATEWTVKLSARGIRVYRFELGQEGVGK